MILNLNGPEVKYHVRNAGGKFQAYSTSVHSFNSGCIETLSKLIDSSSNVIRSYLADHVCEGAVLRSVPMVCMTDHQGLRISPP